MNLEIIEQHNKLADQGVYSFWLKMNEFGDLTNKEFVMRYNGYRMDLKRSTSDRKVFTYNPYNDVPDAVGKLVNKLHFQELDNKFLVFKIGVKRDMSLELRTKANVVPVG